MSYRLAAAVLAVLLLTAPPAAAHKMRIFATDEGNAISGTLFFGGKAPARGVAVTLLDPAGRVVAETVSGDDGRFRFAIAGAFDHRLVADTGDGHRAEFVVRLNEAPVPPATADSEPADRIERMVEQAVARQLAPLREQLDAFEQRVLWRDVLGGVGYIAGLGGLAAWLMSRHRRAHGVAPPLFDADGTEAGPPQLERQQTVGKGEMPTAPRLQADFRSR